MAACHADEVIEALGPARRQPDDAEMADAERPAVADAAALGVGVLADLIAGAQEGITIVDAQRRFVYANPAACDVLGSLEQLRGRDFIEWVPESEREFVLSYFAEQVAGRPASFTGTLVGVDGSPRELVCSNTTIEIGGSPHGVAIFRDLTGPRGASRTAIALAQAAAQLAGTGSSADVLTNIARHAVEGSRAVSCGITVVDEENKLASAGAYGPPGPGYGEANPAWTALAGAPVEEVIAAMTAGMITIGEPPSKPAVLPDARSLWEANPITAGFAANLYPLDWQAGVYLPLAEENRVVGFFAVFLPSGLAGPSEEELAFYTALADQAAVAVTNARLAVSARQGAALMERARLSRDLHDSVSQALFSMTMHARGAQLSMTQAGVDENSSLGRSLAELVELTRGALAEMRALIFELRPGALAEEGLVAALRRQAAALSAREQVAITVDGPQERLALADGVEEHLYRLASEALHNVAKHAGAEVATVHLEDRTGHLRLQIHDNGVGFDAEATRAGHIGLSTMAERAEVIGAQLSLTSSPGRGTTVVVSLPHNRQDEPPPCHQAMSSEVETGGD
jgi:PAS domain S-box-containing protein